MKKVVISIISLLIISMISISSVNAASKEVTLIERGVVVKSNTLIPAAEFLKAVGGQVTINKTNDVVITYNGATVQTKVNSKYAKVNGSGTTYNVSIQVVNGKLMIPLQMIKEVFKGAVSIEYGDLDFGEHYLKSLNITVQDVNVTVSINDLYETYAKYIGKQSWLFYPGLFYDLSGNLVLDDIENLAEVKIKDVKRDSSLTSYIDVYFFYKGRTLRANIPEYKFSSAFIMSSPYKTYHFSQKVWDLIRKKTISIGMTTDMVYLAWGLYSRHSSYTYSWGTTDMWVYEHSYSSDDYLFFRDDILTSFSD
ncbi:hypothetical protein D3C72_426520 [compost metagenome]